MSHSWLDLWPRKTHGFLSEQKNLIFPSWWHLWRWQRRSPESFPIKFISLAFYYSLSLCVLRDCRCWGTSLKLDKYPTLTPFTPFYPLWEMSSNFRGKGELLGVFFNSPAVGREIHCWMMIINYFDGSLGVLSFKTYTRVICVITP